MVTRRHRLLGLLRRGFVPVPQWLDVADSYPVHILKTLGMFFVTGDPNPRHSAALPLLGRSWSCPSSSALALLATARRPRVCADLSLPVFLIPRYRQRAARLTS